MLSLNNKSIRRKTRYNLNEPPTSFKSAEKIGWVQVVSPLFDSCMWVETRQTCKHITDTVTQMCQSQIQQLASAVLKQFFFSGESKQLLCTITPIMWAYMYILIGRNRFMYMHVLRCGAVVFSQPRESKGRDLVLCLLCFLLVLCLV